MVRIDSCSNMKRTVTGAYESSRSTECAALRVVEERLRARATTMLAVLPVELVALRKFARVYAEEHTCQPTSAERSLGARGGRRAYGVHSEPRPTTTSIEIVSRTPEIALAFNFSALSLHLVRAASAPDASLPHPPTA